MPTQNLYDHIRGFVRGDDLEIRRTVSALPAGRSVVQAWMTIKQSSAASDAQALVQKVITLADSAAGVIEKNGASDGEFVGVFRFSGADTLLFDAQQPWDIQLQYENDALYTPFKGTIRGVVGITQATPSDVAAITVTVS